MNRTYVQCRAPTARILSWVLSHINVYFRNRKCDKILDLFAGTGSFSIYLSRHINVRQIVFVENNYSSVARLKRFVENKYSSITSLDESCIRYTVIRADVFKFNYNDSFDLIIIDPPYRFHLCDRILSFLIHTSLIHENTLLILRHSIDEKVSLLSVDTLIGEKAFGMNNVKIFRRSSILNANLTESKTDATSSTNLDSID